MTPLSTFSSDLVAKAATIVRALALAKLRVATAESCTGGLVAGVLTEIPGASDVLDRGYVTYSNEAKTALLGVEASHFLHFGAVSAEVAVGMSEGALLRADADLAIAVTGIAGPGGGSAEKPVGLVHFALARRGGPTRHLERRFGDIGRSAVRLASVGVALGLIEEALAPPAAAAP